MYKILIIEDDTTISSIIQEKLSSWEYHAQCIQDFQDVLVAFVSYAPHLVLLDINLPYFDGYHWCNKIRQISKVPILFISSRDANTDMIRAVTQGGDDYIEKPFSLDVLIAKVQALLRRSYSYIDTSLNTLEHNNMILDVESAQLFFGPDSISLTRNECRILGLLIRNATKTVSRARLIKMLWDDQSFVDDNTLTVNVNRLRKKLSQVGLSEWVETIKGEGYRLV